MESIVQVILIGVLIAIIARILYRKWIVHRLKNKNESFWRFALVYAFTLGIGIGIMSYNAYPKPKRRKADFERKTRNFKYSIETYSFLESEEDQDYEEEDDTPVYFSKKERKALKKLRKRVKHGKFD